MKNDIKSTNKISNEKSEVYRNKNSFVFSMGSRVLKTGMHENTLIKSLFIKGNSKKIKSSLIKRDKLSTEVAHCKTNKPIKKKRTSK